MTCRLPVVSPMNASSVSQVQWMPPMISSRSTGRTEPIALQWHSMQVEASSYWMNRLGCAPGSAAQVSSEEEASREMVFRGILMAFVRRELKEATTSTRVASWCCSVHTRLRTCIQGGGFNRRHYQRPLTGRLSILIRPVKAPMHQVARMTPGNHSKLETAIKNSPPTRTIDGSA